MSEFSRNCTKVAIQLYHGTPILLEIYGFIVPFQKKSESLHSKTFPKIEIAIFSFRIFFFFFHGHLNLWPYPRATILPTRLVFCKRVLIMNIAEILPT